MGSVGLEVGWTVDFSVVFSVGGRVDLVGWAVGFSVVFSVGVDRAHAHLRSNLLSRRTQLTVYSR